MRIGIIGAGQIGGTLTRRLAALGHDVRVSNSRTPDTLAELEAETGAKAVRSTDVAMVSLSIAALMSSLVTVWPSSCRSRFSSSTFIEKGSFEAPLRPFFSACGRLK